MPISNGKFKFPTLLSSISLLIALCLCSLLGIPNLSFFQNKEKLNQTEVIDLEAITLPSSQIANALKLSSCSEEVMNSTSTKQILAGLKTFQVNLLNNYNQDHFKQLAKDIFNSQEISLSSESCLPPLVIGAKQSKLEVGKKILLDNQIISCGTTPQISVNNSFGYLITDSLNNYIAYLASNQVTTQTAKQLRGLLEKKDQIKDKAELDLLQQEISKAKLAKASAKFYIKYGQLLATLYETICSSETPSLNLNQETNTPQLRIISSSSWQNKSIINQTASFRITFKSTPSATNIDSVVGLSNRVATSYDSLGPILRFGPLGKVKARNGAVYDSVQDVNYLAGKTYTITLEVNVLKRTYSLSIKNPAGTTFQIATNYAFNTTQAAVTQLNNLGTYTLSGSNKVTNISTPIAIATPTPVPTATPTPTPTPVPTATPTPVPTVTPPEQIPGLIGHWNFNDSTLSDLTANHSGVENQATTFTTGFDGKNASFNGSSFARFVTSPSITTDQITLATWVYVNQVNTSGEAALIARQYGSGYSDSYVLALNSSGQVVFSTHNGINSTLVLSSPVGSVSTGRWYHITATSNASESKIYIDGVLAVSGIGGHILTDSNPVTLGAGENAADNTVNEFYNGLLDDVRIYSKSLTAGEVQIIFSLISPPTPTPTPTPIPGACGTILSGGTDTRIRWNYPTPPVGQVCLSEVQTGTCNNGIMTWIGNFSQEYCDINPAVVVKKSSVTRHDITWNFDKEYDVARFINGDWAVIAPTGTTIIVNSIDIAGKSSETRDNEMNQGLHGSAVNLPGGKQVGNSQLGNYITPSKFPIIMAAGDSLTSFISLVQGDQTCVAYAGKPAEGNIPAVPPILGYVNVMDYCERLLQHAYVKGASVLTVVATPPPAGTFRPSPLGDVSNRKFYRVQDMDTLVAGLPKLEVPQSAVFDINKLIRTKERFQFEGINSWVRRFTAPADNQATYASYSYNAEALLALAYNHPIESKKLLAVAIIQHGIDLEGAARLDQLVPAEGGHSANLVSVMAVTSALLKSESYNASMGLISGNGETAHTYYGQGNVPLWGKTCPGSDNFNITCFQNQEPSQGSKDCRDPQGIYDQLKKPTGTYICVDYQELVSPYYPGQALAMGLLGAVNNFNHKPFFDYTDRWMNLNGGTSSPFVSEMWKLHRSKASW